MRVTMEANATGARTLMRVGNVELVALRFVFQESSARTTLRVEGTKQAVVGVPEASRISGVPAATIRRLIRSGEVAAEKRGGRWYLLQCGGAATESAHNIGLWPTGESPATEAKAAISRCAGFSGVTSDQSGSGLRPPAHHWGAPRLALPR